MLHGPLTELLLDTHLMYQYGLVAAQLSNEKYDDRKHFGKGVERRFIVHTDGAQETTEEEFYTTGQPVEPKFHRALN